VVSFTNAQKTEWVRLTVVYTDRRRKYKPMLQPCKWLLNVTLCPVHTYDAESRRRRRFEHKLLTTADGFRSKIWKPQWVWTTNDVITSTGLSRVSESIIQRRNSLFQDAPGTDGSTSFVVTTPRLLTFGDEPRHVDIRGWRYGPRRLRVNDDDIVCDVTSSNVKPHF